MHSGQTGPKCAEMCAKTPLMDGARQRPVSATPCYIGPYF